MAGIKMLDKRPGNLDFIMNELLRPDIRPMMFDDSIGLAEISIMFFDPFTMIYGIFEKGHPIPIGTIILEGIRPFRGCEIHAAIFRPENRNVKKIQGVANQLRQDLLIRWNLHYAEARVVSSNTAATHLLEKLGMTKVGTKQGNIVSNGAYVDVDEYYVVLNGDKLFDLDIKGE
jgi:RimJ/RimL family protein N-acetyltransferase